MKFTVLLNPQKVQSTKHWKASSKIQKNPIPPTVQSLVELDVSRDTFKSRCVEPFLGNDFVYQKILAAAHLGEFGYRFAQMITSSIDEGSPLQKRVVLRWWLISATAQTEKKIKLGHLSYFLCYSRDEHMWIQKINIYIIK